MCLSANGRKRAPDRTVPCCLAISVLTSSKSNALKRGSPSYACLKSLLPVGQCKLHGFGQVNRSAARGLEYLLSTAEPIRNDKHFRIRLPNRGQ
jgi:hypothetical protein